MAAQKPDAPGCADARYGGLHLVRIDALGVSALEAEKNRAIRTMADAGERERPIKTNGNLARCLKKSVARQFRYKLVCCAHRPHSVRARRANADLEDVKYAQRHPRKPLQASARDSRLALPPTAAVLMLIVCSVAKRAR